MNMLLMRSAVVRHTIRNLTPARLQPTASSRIRFLSAQPSQPVVSVSARAAQVIVADWKQRILDINKQDGTSHALRVYIESGGCHGFQYKMELTSDISNDDVVFEKDGAKVVMDTTSLDLVRGSTVDYVEDLIGSSFQVVGNPNAESSCGCKTSFNIKL